MKWPVRPLGTLADTALGKMLDNGKSKGLPKVAYLRNVNVQWGRIDTDNLKTMELADAERERFGVRAGDLLVCEGGEIGRCAIWQGRVEFMAYQKALHRIRPHQSLDSRFLRYLLEHYSINGTLAGLSTGSTIAHLPQQQLQRIPVPHPPLDVQHRIVDLLEDHLSRLDAAAEGLSNARRRIESLERSLLETHFAGGSSVTLGELIDDISSGKSFGSSNAPAGEDEWGIIKVSAMTWGEFNPRENKAVAGHRVDPRFEIQEGDLLVSRANTADYVGASVLVGPVRPKLLLSDKSLRITPKAGVNREWLWRALQAPSARRQMSALATGTKDSMRNISQAALRQVKVPNVGEAMQSEALDALGAVAVSTNQLRAEIASDRIRLGNLRRALLAAAFSGRLTSSVPDLLAAMETITA